MSVTGRELDVKVEQGGDPAYLIWQLMRFASGARKRPVLSVTLVTYGSSGVSYSSVPKVEHRARVNITITGQWSEDEGAYHGFYGTISPSAVRKLPWLKKAIAKSGASLSIKGRYYRRGEISLEYVTFIPPRTKK